MIYLFKVYVLVVVVIFGPVLMLLLTAAAAAAAFRALRTLLTFGSTPAQNFSIDPQAGLRP
jgi:hypothetical protein